MEIVEFEQMLQNEYGNTFIFHPAFCKEFIESVSKSGVEKQIIKQLLNKLHAIIHLDNVDFGMPWLERLKQCDNMYSLHINEGKKNFRLLYSKTKSGRIFLRIA